MNPTALSCGVLVTEELCVLRTPLATQITPMVHDELQIHATVTGTITVPGTTTATSGNFAIADFHTVGAPNGGSAGPPYAASSTLRLSGYSGPPNPLGQTPIPIEQTGFYLAVAGFGAGYGEPNAGYSFTGMDADIIVTNTGPANLDDFNVGYEFTLPSAPVNINIDGGTPGAPAILPDGEIGQITAALTGEGSQDFYTFQWHGGLFQTVGSVQGAPADGSYQYQLFDKSGATLDDITLDSTDGFSSTISQYLAPGQYVVGAIADSPNDPLLTLTFNTPVGPAPEPATWTMMLLGLGAAGGALRMAARRRSLAAPVG
ncbi:MAG TPA: PEPxxWA-CTERM sorting domain-containing protein [Caulobacteraceae bacterium]